MLNNLEAIQAPTIISNRLKGRVMKRIVQSDNPIFTVATQKITNTDNHTTVPETNTEVLLLPKDLAYNQKMNTRTAVSKVSQKPQMENILISISAIPGWFPKKDFTLGITKTK